MEYHLASSDAQLSMVQLMLGAGEWQDMTKSLNVVKSFKDSMGKHSFMARCLIGIKRYHDKPGETIDDWHPLGTNEWWDDEGTVSPLDCVLLRALRISPLAAARAYMLLRISPAGTCCRTSAGQPLGRLLA